MNCRIYYSRDGISRFDCEAPPPWERTQHGKVLVIWILNLEFVCNLVLDHCRYDGDIILHFTCNSGLWSAICTHTNNSNSHLDEATPLKKVSPRLFARTKVCYYSRLRHLWSIFILKAATYCKHNQPRLICQLLKAFPQRELPWWLSDQALGKLTSWYN